MGGEWFFFVLELMVDSGDVYIFIEGIGYYYGQFVINGLDIICIYFFQDGVVWVCDFIFKLICVDDGLLFKVVSVVIGLL